MEESVNKASFEMVIMFPALSADGAILKFQPLGSPLVQCLPLPPKPRGP